MDSQQLQSEVHSAAIGVVGTSLIGALLATFIVSRFTLLYSFEAIHECIGLLVWIVQYGLLLMQCRKLRCQATVPPALYILNIHCSIYLFRCVHTVVIKVSAGHIAFGQFTLFDLRV